MPKRSSHEAMQAVMPASRADSGVHVKSRSGRVVKPKVWDDGTVAAPVAALKDEPAELMEKQGDPDYSDDPVEEHLSDEVAREEYGLDSEEDAYSDGPMASFGSLGSRGRYGASRDESGKFAQGRSRGGRGRGQRTGGSSTTGGGIFKQAAVEILRQEKRLLSTGEIARLALKRGLIKCSGKTPEATMASALYTDIKRREGHSIFIRPHEGLFGLREWIEQGVPFQDDYAEEMAKRARANFGYMGMMPPVVDKEGKPLPSLPYSFPPYSGVGPVGVTPAMELLPPIGLPPIPGCSGNKGKGRGGKAAAAAAAVAALASAHSGDEDDEGLMQLLNAAEELHRSSSKAEQEEEASEQAQHDDDMAVDKPSNGSEDEGAGSDAPFSLLGTHGQQQQASDSHGPVQAMAAAQQRRRPRPSLEPCSSGGGTEGGGMSQGAAVAAIALQDAIALASLARPLSRATSSVVPSEGGSKGDGAGASGEEGGSRGHGLLPPDVAAGIMPAGLLPAPALGEAGSFAYPPFNPYFHPYLSAFAGAPQPPTGEGEDGVEGPEDSREDGAALGLLVTGSSKPLQLRRLAPTPSSGSLGGQEQVNILNLPLPDFEGGAKAEPALPRVSSEQLKQGEALVMKLETEQGTSHPEVGKALLSLAKLYMADGSMHSRQLATAAISRAQDIMTLCQLALSRQTTCGSAFAYLMDKAKAAVAGPRAVDITVAAGDAAHVSLAGGLASAQ